MILVTGGTGFLGGHLLLELLKEDIPVRVLISENGHPEKVLSVWKHYTGNGASLLKKADWYAADISNKAMLEPAFEGVTKVYHCAALVSFNPGAKKKMHEINVLGTKNVVDLCLEHKIKKLVHVSSIAAVRSSLKGEPASESDGWPVMDRLWYSKTKTAAEMEVWRGETEGLETVTVNPSVMLGPGEWHSGSPRLFGVCYNGLKFYTHGTTGFVDVRDVAKIMVMLMKSNIRGERFILNAANLSFEEVFRKIARALKVKEPGSYAGPFLAGLAWRFEYLKHLLTGRPPVLTKDSAWSAHRRHAYSSKKVRETLGCNFRSIDETIGEVAEMFSEEGG
ncbi:MAG: NAD-dependent epimerase/dehydratase family protein [Bacteroidales bacterium]|jgi:nucleoside-diphosphate-sugar epimerase